MLSEAFSDGEHFQSCLLSSLCRIFLGSSLGNCLGCFLLGHSLSFCLSFVKKSTDGKAYLLVFVVDLNDLRINDLAELKNIGRLSDASLCDLRNVDYRKTIVIIYLKMVLLLITLRRMSEPEVNVEQLACWKNAHPWMEKYCRKS